MWSIGEQGNEEHLPTTDELQDTPQIEVEIDVSINVKPYIQRVAHSGRTSQTHQDTVPRLREREKKPTHY